MPWNHRDNSLAIPEGQLQTWAGQAATATASYTHASVRAALSAATSPTCGRDYEVYLQGSYKNDTNIRGDSDVDIVVQLNSTITSDIEALDPRAKAAFDLTHPPATYRYEDFRRDVAGALTRHYGAGTVRNGNKALKVQGGSGRLNADVVVCITHIKYAPGLLVPSPVEGMAFFTQDCYRHVVNFPKLHYDRGVQKNFLLSTNSWFKRSVRMFKNTRTYMVERWLLGPDVAPSYFLECFLYNVPDNQFGTSHQHTFRNVLDWLRTADLPRFLCQNGQLPLFGFLPEQWSTPRAEEFVRATIDLWNNW